LARFPQLTFDGGETLSTETDPLPQAYEQFRLGRYDLAERHCRIALERNPDNAEIHHLLGAIRFQQGNLEEALALLKRATISPGATAEHHNNLGCALFKLGEKDAAIAAFERALALNPGYAAALANLGAIYREGSKPGKAVDAVDASPQEGAFRPELLQAMPHLGAAYHGIVPRWHFAMMADRKRNESYEAAIRRAAPGKRVLDIGTGAGLLALMAARAGAAKVTTCEAVPLIAERARQNIRINGLSDRIAVIPMKSTSISVPGIMAERAEVLVTETFASGLLTEGVLPLVEHAHDYLLTPDATIIPAAASVMGYLAGGPQLEEMLFAGKVAGFDLSAFNDFAPHMLDIALGNLPHSALSDDIELMRFDLKEKRFPAGGVRLPLKATRHGVCAGVAQWIKLELDAQTKYENRPSREAGYNGHWTQIVHRFSRLVTVKPGDVVPILFRHDRTQIGIDLLE
jgi:SAM-dependent methyltransferase